MRVETYTIHIVTVIFTKWNAERPEFQRFTYPWAGNGQVVWGWQWKKTDSNCRRFCFIDNGATQTQTACTLFVCTFAISFFFAVTFGRFVNEPVHFSSARPHYRIQRQGITYLFNSCTGTFSKMYNTVTRREMIIFLLAQFPTIVFR